ARLSELQTKLYEPATSLDSIYLVNVASYEQCWIQADPEAAELVISAAAELIRHAAAAGRQVGLVTNGIDNLTHERPRSALGRGPRPLTRSLEILARLGPYAVGAPETLFLRERGRLPWGATLVIVTPRLGQGLANAAIALRRAPHRVLVVSGGESDDLPDQRRGTAVVMGTLVATALIAVLLPTRSLDGVGWLARLILFVVLGETYLWRVTSIARGAMRWTDARNAAPFAAVAIGLVAI